MAEERRPGPLAGDAWIHAPLPYRVVLRIVLDQDRPPERVEVKVVAYSLMEAIVSAAYQQAGTLDRCEYKVESVEPDFAAYLALMAARLREAAGHG